MHLTWSLKELYESFDSESFKNDMVLLASEIETLNAIADRLGTVSSVEDYFRTQEIIQKVRQSCITSQVLHFQQIQAIKLHSRHKINFKHFFQVRHLLELK